MAEKKASAEATFKNIRRRTRRKNLSEEKIRIVIEGLKGENTVTELCRREASTRISRDVTRALLSQMTTQLTAIPSPSPYDSYPISQFQATRATI